MKQRGLWKWLAVAAVISIAASALKTHARDLESFRRNGWVDPDEGW